MSALTELGILDVSPGVCTGPGRWSASTDTDLVTSFNPANGKIIGRVYTGSVHDMEAAAREASTFAARWQSVPAPERARLVLEMRARLLANTDSLATLIALETGMILADARAEVASAASAAEFAAAQALIPKGVDHVGGSAEVRVQERWHPLGVVGVITGFRTPVATWARHAFMAAVCGNCVIWKPSPKAPLVAVAIQHLCNQAMDETGHRGVFHLLTDRRGELGERLANDDRVQLICYAGFSGGGRRVNEAVAHRMGRAILTLSGNNSVVVDESGDVELAAGDIASALANLAGQRLSTPRRILVQEGRCRELTDALVNQLRGIKVGDPLDPLVGMGPLIGPDTRNIFQNDLVAIRAWGGEVLYGAEVLDASGNFVQPTLVRARNHWDVVQRESFVPILYLMTYRTFNEAVSLNNGVRQGLSSSLYSTDLGHIERFTAADGSDCGVAHINLPAQARDASVAFGGEKASGIGREGGSSAWMNYCRCQTRLVRWAR